MEFVTLNNGVKMPMLGYGAYQADPVECEAACLMRSAWGIVLSIPPGRTTTRRASARRSQGAA